jgi:hypothetical protein
VNIFLKNGLTQHAHDLLRRIQRGAKIQVKNMVYNKLACARRRRVMKPLCGIFGALVKLIIIYGHAISA